MTAPTNNPLNKNELDKLDEQDLRDIFNKYGLNYSQIVGAENTVVSCSLFVFNKALKDIVELVATHSERRTIEPRLDEATLALKRQSERVDALRAELRKELNQ